MRTQLFAIGIAGALGLGLGAAAGAEGLDGTKPLVCDLSKVSQCDGVAHCSELTLEQVQLPPSIQVDPSGKRLVSLDAQRASPIATVQTLDTALVLQGAQNGHAWSMVIDRATGHLTATVADAQGAHVIAGACTEQEPGGPAPAKTPESPPPPQE